MKIHRNSWHYIYAQRGDWSDYWHRNADFCTYARKVLFGLTRTLLCYALAGFLISPVADAIAWAAAFYTTGLNPGLTWGGMALIFGTGVVCLIATFAGICWLIDKYNQRLQSIEPGFVRTAYSAWKDKYCPTVEIEP